MRRAAWPITALAAAGVLVALALHGERPGAGFARYEPEGVMVHLPPSEVSAVEISTPAGEHLRYVRDTAGAWKGAVASAATPSRKVDAAPSGARETDAAPSDALETGLRFLHGSAPQRIMAPEELAGTPLSEIGLAPPRLVVSVFTQASGAPFVVEFGAPNPQGLARYARVGGRAEVVLLNRYVAEAWESVAAR